MRHRAGFTLIELLVVIAIILALAVAIVPNIGAGISGTQLGTASRSLLQAARYARTMALLHQVETELVLVTAGEGARRGVSRGNDGKIDPASARIEVRVAAEALQHAAVMDGSADSYGDASGEPSGDGRFWPPDDAGNAEDGEEGDSAAAPASGAVSSNEALSGFADEIHAVFPCGTIVFEFTGFLDDEEPAAPAGGGSAASRASRGGSDSDADVDDLAERTIAILFDSDGICRPFSLRLRDGNEDGAPAMSIEVDRWGKGRIEGRDDG